MILSDDGSPSILDVLLSTGFIAPTTGDVIEHEFDDIGRSHFSNLKCFHDEVDSIELVLFRIIEPKFDIYSLIYDAEKHVIIVEHQNPEITYDDDLCYCSDGLNLKWNWKR